MATPRTSELSVVTRQATGSLHIHTDGPGFTDITRAVADWLSEVGAEEGLLTVFIAHTSASLTIQENVDPDVLRDLTDALERSAPYDHPYRHGIEGPDDMPAHIKAMLTSTSLSIPVATGRPVLGTWQGIYLIEHRAQAHRRRVAIHFIGSGKGDR
jgi:secondary thiamine-phosphate synthase enzyme